MSHGRMGFYNTFCTQPTPRKGGVQGVYTKTTRVLRSASMDYALPVNRPNRPQTVVNYAHNAAGCNPSCCSETLQAWKKLSNNDMYDS